MVLATDPETGHTTAREVLAVWVSPHDGDLLDVAITGPDGTQGVVETTDGHKFWSVSVQGWVEAQHLTEGEQLRQPDGTTATVVTLTPQAGAADMWDLTIADLHTFYVAAGDESVLVRNCGNADLLRANMEARGRYGTGDLQPHHIVPHGSCANRAAADSLARAPSEVERLGIDINDADNGVYLKKGCHQSVGHTNDMFRRLDGALSGASTADQARGILRGFGRELHNLCL